LEQDHVFADRMQKKICSFAEKKRKFSMIGDERVLHPRHPPSGRATPGYKHYPKQSPVVSKKMEAATGTGTIRTLNLVNDN